MHGGCRGVRIVDVVLGGHEVLVAVRERLEIGFAVGALPRRIRLEIVSTSTEVGPSHHICGAWHVFGKCFGKFGEELGVLVSGAGFLELAVAGTSEFGERHDFAMLRSLVGNHLHILDHSVDPCAGIVCGIIGIVFVITEYVHPLVARVGGEIISGITVEYAAGGVGIKQIVHIFDVTQIVNDVAVQFLVFTSGSMRGAPPEPAAIVLVQWTEDDWNQCAVAAFGLLRGGGDGVELLVEGAGVFAAGKQFGSNGSGVVEILAGAWVVPVCGQCHDGAFAVRIGDVLGERLGVGVLVGT